MKKICDILDFSGEIKSDIERFGGIDNFWDRCPDGTVLCLMAEELFIDPNLIRQIGCKCLNRTLPLYPDDEKKDKLREFLTLMQQGFSENELSAAYSIASELSKFSCAYQGPSNILSGHSHSVLYECAELHHYSKNKDKGTLSYELCCYAKIVREHIAKSMIHEKIFHHIEKYIEDLRLELKEGFTAL